LRIIYDISMTKQTIVDLMKELKTSWGILKNDKLSVPARRTACQAIIELSNKAKELDPKFDVIDMTNTQYSDFVPKTYTVKSNVNWGTCNDMSLAESKALSVVSRLEAIAVQHIKEKLPNEAEDSQKFGMIVSAFTEKLLNAYIYINQTS